MTPRILGAVGLVALAVTACGPSSPPPPPPPPTTAGAGGCMNGHCQLTVTVADGGCTDPSKISVDPDPLPVPKKKFHTIEWTIATAHYTWQPPPPPAPGGISGLPSPPFSNPKVNGNGDKYTIDDANMEDAPTEYKYGVNLQSGGKNCVVKDPTIINGK